MAIEEDGVQLPALDDENNEEENTIGLDNDAIGDGILLKVKFPKTFPLVSKSIR
jgi:hypothetical protein